MILPKQFQTENVQYVDQEKDAESNLNQQVKKDFKDQKDLEKPKERAIDGRDFVLKMIVLENGLIGRQITVVKMMILWNQTKVYKISKVEVDNEKGPEDRVHIKMVI